jgi:hypothetical protein
MGKPAERLVFSKAYLFFKEKIPPACTKGFQYSNLCSPKFKATRAELIYFSKRPTECPSVRLRVACPFSDKIKLRQNKVNELAFSTRFKLLRAVIK